jgi:predicted unusual protein kinase regulating ubiquinone biosynthesis (AarF/ABC1/UbiB family)
MEVRALMDLANKTLSRFPFRLPKNLALYMRMASILEGIYHHHHVRFQFVKVLANLLEEEGLVRDAYVEEIKVSVRRFVKGVEASVEVAPMLKSYLEAQQLYGKTTRNQSPLAVSIIASALFVGSALIYSYNPVAAYAGFASAGAAVIIALKKAL